MTGRTILLLLLSVTIIPTFICIQDRPHFAVQHNVAKDNAKICDLFLHSHDDSSEPVPSTSSEPVDNSPPTQEGKQTSQKSRNTSDSPRSNQNQMRTVDCNEGPQDRGYQKQC